MVGPAGRPRRRPKGPLRGAEGPGPLGPGTGRSFPLPSAPRLISGQARAFCEEEGDGDVKVEVEFWSLFSGS